MHRLSSTCFTALDLAKTQMPFGVHARTVRMHLARVPPLAHCAHIPTTARAGAREGLALSGRDLVEVRFGSRIGIALRSMSFDRHALQSCSTLVFNVFISCLSALGAHSLHTGCSSQNIHHTGLYYKLSRPLRAGTATIVLSPGIGVSFLLP